MSREVDRATRSLSGPPPMSEAGRVDFDAGKRFGRYELLECIGSGGMAVVYRAHDPQLDRDVALKVLRPSKRRSRSRTRRLLREARALAELNHPNVVQVFDVGEHRGDVFISMELADGPDLHTWLHERRPTWREIVDAFLQAGEGLQAAHARGLVHRDFKPVNVLMGRGGLVKVADFGLVAQSDSGDSSSSSSAEITDQRPVDDSNTLGALGTPLYMAPEQHWGEFDARSDQFAFCVSLYEGLFLKFPFDGASMDGLAQRKEAGLSRPSDLRDAPRWLLPVLRRGTSPRPEDRFASMASLLRALRRRRRRHEQSLWGAVAGLAIAAGLAWPVPSAQSGASTHESGAASDTVRVEYDKSVHETEFERIEAAIGRFDAAAAADRLESLRADVLTSRASADKARWLLLEARIARLEGDFERVVGANTRAYEAASAAGYDEGVARAATSLIVYGSPTVDAANRWDRATRAALERLGARDDLEVERLRAMAAVYARDRRSQGALVRIEQAHTLAATALPADVDTRFHISLQVIEYRLDAGNTDAAVDLARETAKVAQYRYGPDSPNTAHARASLGIALSHAGELLDAQRELSAALAGLRSVGASSRDTTPVQIHLAHLWRRLGRHAEALRAFAELRPQLRKVGDRESEIVATLQEAECHRILGASEAAAQCVAEARVCAEEAVGADSPLLASALLMEAVLLVDEHDLVSARPLVERVEEMSSRSPLLSADRERLARLQQRLNGSAKRQADDESSALSPR